MTGKVILICGKICSGKSFYADKLRNDINAVILSADEITLLLGQYLGERHEEISGKVRDYLFEKSVQITETGINVILDWGFWQKEARGSAREFYKERGIPCELHYVDTAEELRRENIAKRNRETVEGKTCAYFVDEKLFEKCEELFETPDDGEYDIKVRS